MIFFSKLVGSNIIDSTGEKYGKIVDAIVETKKKNEFLPLTGIIATTSSGGHRKFFISAEHIAVWTEEEVVLHHSFSESISSIPESDDLFQLGKSVLDKQIVDLEGVRVVRVNDLQLAKVGETMSLVAIDISTSALLRRLGLSRLDFFHALKPHLLEWTNVRVLHNKLQLGISETDIVKLHAADIANIVEKLNINQGSQLLQSLQHETAARVLEEIQPDIKKLMVKKLGTDRAAAVMSKMSVDDLVDLIQILPDSDSKEILDKLPIDNKTKKVKKILEYPEESAGGLMTTEFVTAQSSSTVEEVIHSIKELSPSFSSIYFVYVLSHEGRFKGVVSIRQLIVAEKNQTMNTIMNKKKRIAPTATEDQKLLSVAALMTKYDLMSIAVLDKHRRMLGVVTVDDIMRKFVPHA
jgi:magnesium transporter